MATPKTYGLTHIALAVNDISITLEFYRSVFDMEVMYNHTGFLQMTTPGCYDILVFEEKKDHPIGHTGGIKHFGFRLKNPADITEIVKRVVDNGGSIIEQGEFVPGSPYVFFTDPDGYEVEVWYELLQ